MATRFKKGQIFYEAVLPSKGGECVTKCEFGGGAKQRAIARLRKNDGGWLHKCLAEDARGLHRRLGEWIMEGPFAVNGCPGVDDIGKLPSIG